MLARECLRRVGVEGLSDRERLERMREAAREAEGRLEPEAGRVLEAVWFDGEESQGWLLVVIHHLAVDGVSWRILVSDLRGAWSALERGEQPVIEPVGTSFEAWARKLTEYASSAEVVEESGIWEEIVRSGRLLLEGAELEPERDTVGLRGI